MKIVPVFLILVMFTFNSCPGSDSLKNKTIAATDYDFSIVNKIIDNAVADSAFPGAVILILKDGRILHEKAYGNYTYSKKSDTVTVNTIFDLASVSKVIGTTTAVMLCCDRKLFNLDDPVSKYIPEFGTNGKQEITILNLMLHNSGLPSWKKFYSMYDNPDDVLKDIYSSGLEYQTGSKTLYSDLGMITIGKIIEKVTGKSLDNFCRDEIFKPLGMENTFYNPPLDMKERITPTEYDDYWRKRQLQGEVHDETASMLKGVAGHAGLFSTAWDLSKILDMLLHKGRYNGKVFINEETVELFTRRHSSLSSRAIGWDTKSEGSSAGKLFSDSSYGHTGYTGTSVWVDPSRKLAVVFLTNRVYPTRNNTKIIKVRPVVHDAVIKAIGN